jgi:drug/metabolite transporter (DMT)-like permease
MAAVWYAALCLIWGSTWLVIKVGYGGLGPFTVAALRFLLAGALLTPMVPSLGARWPRGLEEWTLVAFVGVVLFGLDYGLIYWAEQFLDSGLTAILFAVLPLLTIACAHLYLPGDRMTPRKLSGALLAFAGVALLFGDRIQLDAATGPMLAVLASALCAAVAAVASKRHGARIHPAALNGPAMLVGGVVLLGAALAAGEDMRFPRDTATWGAIAYLAIAGSIVTFLIYFALLKTWSVTSLSFISVFTPAIALALGFVVLDERPTQWTVAGAGLILVGVTLALTSRSDATMSSG